MGLLDRMIVGAKNLASREVNLMSHSQGYILSIVEHGKERTGFLAHGDVVALQDILWNKRAVAAGIVINVPAKPGEMFSRLEIPHWAMERLRDDMLNERIRLNSF